MGRVIKKERVRVINKERQKIEREREKEERVCVTSIEYS